MLNISRINGPNEDSSDIDGLYGFPQIELHTWIMLKCRQGDPIDQRLRLQRKGSMS